MKNVIRSLLLALVVCGLAVVNLGTAAAQYGHGHHGGHAHYPHRHNTTHFDYHPGSVQRHGNHFHYVPGHFDLHRSSQWHW